MERGKNGLGVTGFVFAIVGVVFFWLAPVAIIGGGLGFIFSLIGLIVGIAAKKRLGLSIAGLIICMVPIITALAVFIGGVSLLDGLI